MILPRFFVFSMSRPTFRPTLSIFYLLGTITGCGAGPRKCVWQGGGVSRRLDKRDAGLLRKEKFSPPDTSGINPRKMISPSPSRCCFLTPSQKAPTRGLTVSQRVHARLLPEIFLNRHTDGNTAVHRYPVEDLLFYSMVDNRTFLLCRRLNFFHFSALIYLTGSPISWNLIGGVYNEDKNGSCSCFSADFCCIKSNGIDFVVLVVGTKSDLAYILVFRRYLFRHFGRRTNC